LVYEHLEKTGVGGGSGGSGQASVLQKKTPRYNVSKTQGANPKREGTPHKKREKRKHLRNWGKTATNGKNVEQPEKKENPKEVHEGTCPRERKIRRRTLEKNINQKNPLLVTPLESQKGWAWGSKKKKNMTDVKGELKKVQEGDI